MSEEEGQTAPDAGGVVLDLALTGASRKEADAFVREQRRLTALQIEKLVTQEHFEQSHLHWRRFNDRMKGALQIMGVALGLAVVGGLALMVWNAAHSEGLIVESFAVPPGLAGRGLSGHVVAGKLLDRLTAMQSETRANDAVRSYAANWGNDLKVEIPETGVSLGELYRYLRGWLGHDTRISGEVVATAKGISVTARGGDASAATFEGAEAELDTLLQKAAEHVYGATQPNRYGRYLIDHGRRDEAMAVFRATALSGPTAQRAWAYTGLAASDKLAIRERMALVEKALALDPENATAVNNMAILQGTLGHTEIGRAMMRKFVALVERIERADKDNSSRARLYFARAIIDTQDGAYKEAAGEFQAVLDMPNSAALNGVRSSTALSWITAHDLAAARAVPRPTDAREEGRTEEGNAIAVHLLDASMAVKQEDWRTALAHVEAAAQLVKAQPGSASTYLTTTAWRLAEARAHAGDFAGAERDIAATPGDCYPCLRSRAQITALRGQPGRADWWFARAVAEGPSIPFAYNDWGQALLVHGHPDAAIEEFKLANRRGPHFADPIEGWGEALMAKNQSHLALAKFQEAEKYAPNWGRLHLKWGEALLYAGKRDAAKAQFTRAAQLDLTPSEKVELARLHV